MPAGHVNRGRTVAVHRSVVEAGELVKRLDCDVVTGVEARPRRFMSQDVVAVRIGIRDKSDEHAACVQTKQNKNQNREKQKT